MPVDELSLENIADATGGSFHTAATEAELSEVFTDIGSSVGYQTEARRSRRFVGGALVLFTAAAALSLAWFARLLVGGRRRRGPAVARLPGDQHRHAP